MLELEHIRPGIASKEAIIQGWSERKSIGAAKVPCIQGIHGGEDIFESLIDVAPVTPIVVGPSFSGQQPLQAEIWLAIIDKRFLPARHRFRRIFDGVEVERLTHFPVCGYTADAETEIFAQHWHRDGTTHHRSGFLRAWLPTEIIMPHFHRGQTDPIGAINL